MSTSVPGDAELLRRYISSGDPDAFAGLVRTHQDMVYATCLRVLADAHEAEDVAQEVFVRLARHGAAIRDHIGGWLHATAHREAIERAIRCRNAKEREAAWATEQIAARAGTAASAGADLLRHIDEALAELPSADRDLLVRHYLEGVPQTELAVAAGVHQSAISRRLRDAVARLRTILRRRGVPAPALAFLGSEAFRVSAPAGVAAKATAVGLGGVGAATARAGTAWWIWLTVAAGIMAIAAGIWRLALPGSRPPPAEPAQPAAMGTASMPTIAAEADRDPDDEVLALPCVWEADSPLPGIGVFQTQLDQPVGANVRDPAGRRFPTQRRAPSLVRDIDGRTVLDLATDPAWPTQGSSVAMLSVRLPEDARRLGVRIRARVLKQQLAAYHFFSGMFIDPLEAPSPPGARHANIAASSLEIMRSISTQRWFTLSCLLERDASGSTLTSWIDGKWLGTCATPRRSVRVGLLGIGGARAHIDRLRIWSLHEGEVFDPATAADPGP